MFLDTTGLPTFELYETDEPIITAENGYEFVRRSPEFFNLEEVAGYSSIPNTRHRYPKIEDLAQIAVPCSRIVPTTVPRSCREA